MTAGHPFDPEHGKSLNKIFAGHNNACMYFGVRYNFISLFFLVFLNDLFNFRVSCWRWVFQTGFKRQPIIALMLQYKNSPPRMNDRRTRMKTTNVVCSFLICYFFEQKGCENRFASLVPRKL